MNYVTEVKHVEDPLVHFSYEIAPDLESGTTFYSKQCGQGGFILGSVLRSNAYEHESGTQKGHYLQASLGIRGLDAGGRQHTLSGTILRGSPSRCGTTESLAPGESLTIRFPGSISIVDGPSAPATGKAKLFASLILSDNECRDWQRVTSRPVDIWFRGRN